LIVHKFKLRGLFSFNTHDNNSRYNPLQNKGWSQVYGCYLSPKHTLNKGVKGLDGFKIAGSSWSIVSTEDEETFLTSRTTREFFCEYGMAVPASGGRRQRLGSAEAAVPPALMNIFGMPPDLDPTGHLPRRYGQVGRANPHPTHSSGSRAAAEGRWRRRARLIGSYESSELPRA
jgi:hypothetical protein